MAGKIIIKDALRGDKYVTVISLSNDVKSATLNRLSNKKLVTENKQNQIKKKRLFSPEINFIINPIYTEEDDYVVEKGSTIESVNHYCQQITNFAPEANEITNGVESNVLIQQLNWEENNLTKAENGKAHFKERETLTDPLVNVLPIPQESSCSLNLSSETVEMGQHVSMKSQQTNNDLFMNWKPPPADNQNATEPLFDITGKSGGSEYATNLRQETNGTTGKQISFRTLRDVIYMDKNNSTEADNGTIFGAKRNGGFRSEETENGENKLEIVTENGENKLEIVTEIDIYSSAETDVTQKFPNESQTPTAIQPAQKPTKLRNHIDNGLHQDTLHAKALGKETGCSAHKCLGSIVKKTSHHATGRPRDKTEVIIHAKDFLQQYYASTKHVDGRAHKDRLSEILTSIESRGTYDLTTDELVFGTKTAWRNAPRCIGRIQWSKLKVFDARHVTTAKEMYVALCEHIHYATNGGNIRSVITVFSQRTDGKHDFRVWNNQLIQYAGYRQPDGSVIGDPIHVEFTELCMQMGWRGNGGMFDVLPLLLSANGEDPELFEIPPDLVLEVEITHPNYRWFADLGIRWFGVPIVSGMMLDCGGLEFTACPFNGWYMGTEIGARDLCDIQRYNILEKVAVKMGLDVNAQTNLWKDKALVEVNIAVLHSFQQRNVTIIDHHTASETFMTHFGTEQRVRGGCPADWVWLVPPISGSTLPVFHQEMLNYTLKPSYEYQEVAWKTHVWKKPPKAILNSRENKISFYSVACVVKIIGRVIRQIINTRVKCTILYATETGKSEQFARKLYTTFRAVFNAKVFCMADYDIGDLSKEKLLLVVTSTFGHGDPPENGKRFAQGLLALSGTAGTMRPNRKVWKKKMKLVPTLPDLKYSVFALGSRAYPTFCAFGHYLDNLFERTGATRINATGEGDELYAQHQSFNRWATETFMAAFSEFFDNKTLQMPESLIKLSEPEKGFLSQAFKLVSVNKEDSPSLCDGLSHLHKRIVSPCTLAFRQNLQAPSSSRQTILIKVDTHEDRSMIYEPGDHLAIFPANPKHLVDAILARLDDAPPSDELVKITGAKNGRAKGNSSMQDIVDKFPLFTLRTALTHYLDITSPPSPDMLNALAGEAGRESDAEELRRLGSSDPGAYLLWLKNISPNL